MSELTRADELRLHALSMAQTHCAPTYGTEMPRNPEATDVVTVAEVFHAFLLGKES